MHDLDSTRIGTREYDDELEDEGMSFEYLDDEFEFEFEADDMDEQSELELAEELLSIEDEQELDEFIGKLFKKAVKGVRKFARSGVGKALGGALKSVAKAGLPLAGKAVGNLVAPGIGGVVGGQLGKFASKLFEMEDSEFGSEDSELDAARKFVRMATVASQKAARLPASVPPKHAALMAIKSATDATTSNRPKTRSASPGRSRQGRWIRRGNKVILLGL